MMDRESPQGRIGPERSKMGGGRNRLLVTEIMDLRDRVSAMRKGGTVGFDTEFVGDRSYFPRLCLLQLATEAMTVAVDPLALPDLSPLEDLLFDPSVLKVIHAGWQDLKILFQRTGRVPGPVFDTQVAAALLGQPAQASYVSVVRDLLGVTLRKGHSYSDWCARPLSPSQLSYALDDVRHLPALHARMVERLRDAGRLSWLEPEMAALSSPGSYETVPEQEYRRVKGWASLDRPRLGVLRAVIAWREREAMRRDLPRRWVLADETALAVARACPSDDADLRRIRGVEGKIGREVGATLLSLVREAMDLPADRLPEEAPSRPEGIGERGPVVALLGALLRARARQHRVAAEVLATSEDLERLASGEREGIAVLSGWRRDLLGNELLALLEGKLSLAVRGGRLVASPQPGPPRSARG